MRKTLYGCLVVLPAFLASLTGCQLQNNAASPYVNPQSSGTPVHPFRLQWGGYGSGNGSFNYPAAVAVNAAGTTVYVADRNNSLVQAFDPNGHFFLQWACTLPSGLAVDPAGHVYVATGPGADVIQEFNSNGQTLVAQGGGQGSGNGLFNAPEGLSLDSTGVTLWVADTGNNLIQAVTLTPPSGLAALSQKGGPGNGAGTFNGPEGVALNSQGTTLYVSDNGNNLVQMFSPTTGYLRQWGGLGPNPGQFKGPGGLALGPGTGFLYVSDTGNDRIEEFDPSGVFQYQWGGPGTGAGTFHSPQALALDAAGNVFVADTGNNLIQKFGP